jgi:AcrR family transcriptional regulator
MARPVGADGEATRQRILASALGLFGESGQSGVSVRRIAAAAGVTLATVHHYFGSKEALHAACVDSMYAELEGLERELRAALVTGGAGDTAALMERAIRAGFRFARAHRPAVRLLLRSVVAAGELDPERRDRVQLPFLEVASAALAGSTGRPAAELRLPIQSLVVLAARYGASSDRELCLLAGVSDLPTAERAVEDHLVAAAAALLRPE